MELSPRYCKIERLKRGGVFLQQAAKLGNGFGAAALNRFASLCGCLLLAVTCVGVACALDAQSDPQRGREIYLAQCAACHGDSGQGVADHYPDPLAGDYPRDHLLRIIVETMPEGDPEACVEQDAFDVAAYVFDHFYGKSARTGPDTNAVTRLTAEQLRQNLVGLIASVGDAVALPHEGGGDDDHDAQGDVHVASDHKPAGVKGEYFRKLGFSSKNRELTRTDRQIDFDFGSSAPVDAKKFPKDEFAIRWTGGLMVNQSGLYELRLTTENAAKVWVNDPDRPFIDAGVRSGDVTRTSRRMFLVAGYVYPVMVEFFKRTEKTSSISLGWTTPDGLTQSIPASHWILGEFDKVFVPQTPFPPDDRSEGYERGTSISRSWAEAVVDVALETANEIERRRSQYAPQLENLSAAERMAEARRFAERWTASVFRRPLDESSRRIFVDRFFDPLPTEDEGASQQWNQAIQSVVLTTLQSPRFLYPGLTADEYSVAERLAFTLWDAPPDDTLIRAAADGKLGNEQDLETQIVRMLSDRRTQAKLNGFFRYWLRLDLSAGLAVDPELFPELDQQRIAELQTSLLLMLNEIFWDQASDFRRLLLAPNVPLTRELAAFYQVDWPEVEDDSEQEQEYRSLPLSDQPRAGVLTHPYLLALHAERGIGSPIHRGVFITRGLLGRVLRSPPDAVEIIDESLHPDLTNRQRVELQTKPAKCQTCHGIINPLGFALEHFDGVGRYRTEEQGEPIDGTGVITWLDGGSAAFANAAELGRHLADSVETQRSFVGRMYEYFAKEPLSSLTPDREAELLTDFVESEFQMRRLLIQVAAAAAKR